MKKNAAKNRNRFRGVFLLLVCVALGVVLFVGYPVMMPHIAIVSFTIHQCLCPTLDPLSFARLCLFLFIKLPLANFLFEIQFENSIACKCALCLRCCPKTCSCAFAKKKITKDKLHLLIIQKIKYLIVIEKTIRKKIKTKPLIFLTNFF